MNLTTSWMQSEWTKALGWTFVHSLWQIALIGLLLFLVLRVIPGRKAHIRYTISTLALWFVVVMSLSTFIIMLPETREMKEITGKLVLIGTTETRSLADKISLWLEVRMPMMLTVWSGGVTLLMIRLAFSLGWVRHMRTTATHEPEIQVILNQIILKLRLNIKPKTSSSGLVSSPVTLGHLKPLILFPVGIINQLSPKEVEAILTHELAHIVKRDYLSNLIQSFIETLFYYHPITWWISATVRSERENRADDIAVTWCGDHLGYAKALMTVQEMQIQQGSSLAIGFASRKGAMLARIQRILNLPYKNHNQMEKTVLLSLSTLCFLAFTLTSHTPPDPSAKEVSQIPKTSKVTAERIDSIPTEGIYRIHKKTDEQDISIEMENGDIKELKIDGKEIQPADYDAYDMVINDLFGAVEGSSNAMGFNFRIPAIPAIPMIPDRPYMIEGFEMPEMPEIPEMPNLEWMESLNGFNFNWSGDLSDLAMLEREGLGNLRIMTDSLPGGNTRIIIINGMDSTVICTDQMSWSEGSPSFYYRGEGKMNDEERKRHQEEWQGHAEEWRAHADEWRAQQNEWRNQFRHQADRSRAEKEIMRDINRNQYRLTEESQRAIDQDRMREEIRQQESGMTDRQKQLERELRTIEYLDAYPRLSLSDQMVKDGLIQPGAEVEVQLTPEKLKINGEKMPEVIHQKYLEIYQQQHDVELSGNSRVEFTTKSKQRM